MGAIEAKIRFEMEVAAEAGRLRAAAEAKPLKLPVNRRVSEEHHHTTEDGLSIWYTVQLTGSSRIYETLFERPDRAPAEDECRRWLDALLPGREAAEAPSFPGSNSRRFEIFEAVTD